MANPSLAALLTAVERLQNAQQKHLDNFGRDEVLRGARNVAFEQLLGYSDISALRAAARQHAEALRAVVIKDHADDEADGVVRAAADFLDGGQP